MQDYRPEEGDLVLTTSVTCGELFEPVAVTDCDVTVFVIGSFVEREARMGLLEFIDEAPSNVEIVLTMPLGVAAESLAKPTVSVLPIPVSEYPRAMASLAAEARRVVGVFETTPPVDGEVTPGVFGLGTESVVELADVLFAEENPRAPRLPGLSFSTGVFDGRIEVDHALPVFEQPALSETEHRIGTRVADQVPDGATVQFGIGRLPTAVADSLTDRRNLGLHSGVVGPNVIELVRKRVVTRGSVVSDPVEYGDFDRPVLTSVVLGESEACYNWFEETGVVALGGIQDTHDPAVVGENPMFTAINSGLKVDVVGQINAERADGRVISAPGGQPDFIRASNRSEGGRSIVTLESSNGEDSNIRGNLREDGVVTTPQYEVDFVITENHAARIRGTHGRERIEEVVTAAAPRFREELRNEAERLWIQTQRSTSHRT